MNRRGAAEGDAGRTRSANQTETGRNAGRGDGGAASAASSCGNTTGPGQGLIEQMIARENLNLAWKKVRANRGAAGVDGLDIETTELRLRQDWPGIEARLQAGTYRPEAVRRLEIPKAGGGTRKLGVPTVTDRFVQQALLQVLAPLFEPHFSAHSYGFRPGRSAHQAVLAAREHQRQGKRWVVDLDLASFFDEVDHDLLIARVRRRVKDVRVIQLIRSYLNAVSCSEGWCSPPTRARRKAGPCRRCSPTSCWTTSTGNWRGAATPSAVTPTTATSTLRAGAAANG